jgi:ADP-ribosylglycohydrolase
MFPTYDQLREMLRLVILNKEEQGHVVGGLVEELAILPDSYDFLHAFAGRLARLPLREDWPYVEPDDLAGIWAECDPARPLGALPGLDLADAARRAEAGFLGSVCGCILGKPLEVNPTLAELRAALEPSGDWPLRDYVPVEALDRLGRRHRTWGTTTRGNIRFVASDDDINYTALGMLILEEYGLAFTPADVRDAWLCHLPISMTFGPERTLLLRAGMNSVFGGRPDDLADWVGVLNPGDEKCGALIRADAYGYACAGRPALAAELAWRDASWTHRRTGIYGAMFVAAAIAAAAVLDDPLRVFETALQFVPQRSRFYRIAADSLEEVSRATDWLDGYERIHGKYAQYAHCLVYQECGTLINTLRFAESVGDGICIQVSQGNDTDSFGATAGSFLGVFFGPGRLEERWLAPFEDDLRTTLAQFYERSLSAVAERMGRLPHLVAEQVGG